MIETQNRKYSKILEPGTFLYSQKCWNRKNSAWIYRDILDKSMANLLRQQTFANVRRKSAYHGASP